MTVSTIQSAQANALLGGANDDLLNQLYTAITNKDFGTAKELIENNPSLAGANVRITVPGMGTYGILQFVIKNAYDKSNPGGVADWSNLAVEMINKLNYPLTDTPASQGSYEVDTDSPLYEALSAANKDYYGNYDILNAILDKRPDFIDRLKKDQFQREVISSPLKSAVTMGDMNLVQFLLGHMSSADAKAQANLLIGGQSVAQFAQSKAFISPERKDIANLLASISKG